VNRIAGFLIYREKASDLGYLILNNQIMYTCHYEVGEGVGVGGITQASFVRIHVPN
jgi:hypothetical protein